MQMKNPLSQIFNNLEYTLLDFRRQNCLNKQY